MVATIPCIAIAYLLKVKLLIMSQALSFGTVSDTNSFSVKRTLDENVLWLRTDPS